MKKLFTLILALAFGFGLKAQCPYTEAMDFTANDCRATEVHLLAQVTITVDQVLETEVTATFTPNADCASYNYLLATESEVMQWMNITGLTLPEYLHTYGFPAEETLSHTFTELEPNTEYMIYAVPADSDGNLGEVVQEAVTTTSGGGSEMIHDFTATDIEGNEINLYSILDNGQAVMINFFLFGDEFSEGVMRDMVEAYHLYGCNQHDVFFMEISPNGHDDQCRVWAERFGVSYPTISRDGGGNVIAQAIPVGFYPTIMLIRPDHTIAKRDIYPPTIDYIVDAMNGEGYGQYECEDGVAETGNHDLMLYPNPASHFVTLSGENLGTVSVYNALGQLVEELEANGDELHINTTGYENGVYVVKTEGQTLRFLVRH